MNVKINGTADWNLVYLCNVSGLTSAAEIGNLARLKSFFASFYGEVFAANFGRLFDLTAVKAGLENMNYVMDFDSRAGEQKEIRNRWHSDGAVYKNIAPFSVTIQTFFLFGPTNEKNLTTSSFWFLSATHLCIMTKHIQCMLVICDWY